MPQLDLAPWFLMIILAWSSLFLLSLPKIAEQQLPNKPRPTSRKETTKLSKPGGKRVLRW